MKHGCILRLRCGCGCGTQQFLKNVGAGAAGLGSEKIIKNIFIYIFNILLSIFFYIIIIIIIIKFLTLELFGRGLKIDDASHK